MVTDCPNSEQCGGKVAWSPRTEDAGTPPQSAFTTWIEATSQTCACDLTVAQWEALEEEAVSSAS